MELPPETVYNIFAHAELETCVDLREVSTFWYAAFNQLDARLLKQKPGEDGTELKTWRDCVRVFVGRLGCLEDIKYPTELTESISLNIDKVETTLPKDYKPLMVTREPQYNTMLELDDNYYMDLHTMMAHRSQPPSSLLDFLRTVEETDEIGVYDCDGVRVVVPIDMVTNKTSCDVNEDMVVVYSAQDRSGKGITNRRGQRNMTSGYTFLVEDDDLLRPMVLVVDLDNRRVLHIAETRDVKFDESHVDTDEVPKTNSFLSSVVGVNSAYNGLLWMVDRSPEGYMGLFPIFIDMKDIPEDDGSGTTRVSKMYYCKDRIMLFERYMDSLFSSIPRGAQPYVLFLYITVYFGGKRQESLLIVDLATWNVWLMKENFELNQGSLMYSQDMIDIYKTRLLRMKMLYPRRGEYDVGRDRSLEDDFEVQDQLE
ncbi:LOW QUALITY PROTEIN: hypothetical protein B0I74DRAFT_132651 [Yarrowia lipolytica]|nr:LOW QUALITY PROTEIN: hypothetical protein B0I74DRAFT_132651 [Yarrowia lipolytica]